MKIVRHPFAPTLRALAQEWLPEVRPQLQSATDPAAWFHRYFLERFYQQQLQHLNSHIAPAHQHALGSWDDLAELYPLLLSWQVQLAHDQCTLEWMEGHGSQRKLLGTYYTPACLSDCLLETAFDPLLADAERQPDPRTALLKITICDPACGSGRLLVRAGARLAERLTRYGLTLTEATDHVITHCLFGRDCDALAVSLCRAGIMRHHSRGADLSAQIQQGDSLRTEWLRRFDLVLANPPWGRLKIEAREWRARDAAFTQAQQNARELAQELRTSGRFPLSAHGDLNLYPLFVELARNLLSAKGRAGIIVPSGLATQMATQPLFADLLDKGHFAAWYDFSNRKRLFPDVEGNVKFALLTLTKEPQATFSVAAQLEHPRECNAHRYALSAAQLARVNPHTRHIPPARTASDLQRLVDFHTCFPPLSDGWTVELTTMFHMTNDAVHFSTREQLNAAGVRWVDNRCEQAGRWYWPLYEAKLVQQYNHRHATFAGVAAERRFGLHAAPRVLTGQQSQCVEPRYWVESTRVIERVGVRPWLLTLRNAISTTADARSLVATLLPAAVGVGNSLVLGLTADPVEACLLLAFLNSLVLDYVVKQKAGGSNLNFHIVRQLPLPARTACNGPCPWAPGQVLADWIVDRVLRLSCAAGDWTPLSRALNRSLPAPPWNAEERFSLRCELDAACFYLYGVRDCTAILQSFPILKKRDEKEHGTFRTYHAIQRQLDRLHAGRGCLATPDVVPGFE